MDEQEIRFRVAEAPVGGGRIAWSYLGTLLAALVATLLWAAWSPFGGGFCGPDNPTCELGWNIVGFLGALVLALALPAYVLRLGWEWWGVGAAVLLGTPVWGDGATPRTILIVALGMPLLAALLTWRGPARPRWRPWLVAGLLALAVGGSALVLLLLF